MEKIDLNDKSCDEIKGTLLELVEKSDTSSKIVNVRVEPGSKKGDNFIGVIYRVLFERAEEGNKQFSYILKMAPQDSERREKIPLKDFFNREIIMYDEILPFLRDFQLSKGVNPDENGFNEHAKCHNSLRTDMSECLLLEDLRSKQMDMLNHRKDPYTFDHVALVMKALGKLHAISFALKDQQPEKFEELVECIPELYYHDGETFQNFFNTMLNVTHESLEKTQRPDLLTKLKNMVGEGFCETGIKTVCGKLSDYAVICHGDAWINNIMFQHNELGKPLAINLIDWQFSRYASPVTDIVINLICCTSKELRDAHFNDLLKVYHESLTDLLTQLGSDAEKLFSYNAFLGEMKKYGKYAAIVGTLLLPLLSIDIDSIPDEDTSDLRAFTMSEEAQRGFDKKMLDMMGDLAEYNYI